MSTNPADPQTNTHLLPAKQVLLKEADALKALADFLDGSFDAVVSMILEAKGRVVVTGMGKSGHVAGKIAATLSSTGTPAIFLHPGEASHGDMGMITSEDVILALSNSGETTELSDVVMYSRRHKIPLIAMTQKPGSALESAADLTLLTPQVPEACPMGMAPTTSSTMMLALGDALAVALLTHKGFSSRDFHNLHPGGKLGQKLLRVEKIMHTGDQVPLVDAGTSMAEAIVIMTEKSLGCVGVVSADGELIGVVTDGDLRRHMSGDLLAKSVNEVMNGSPKSIQPHVLAEEAVSTLNENSITSLFVTSNNKVVGLIHLHDCLRAGIV